MKIVVSLQSEGEKIAQIKKKMKQVKSTKCSKIVNTFELKKITC